MDTSQVTYKRRYVNTKEAFGYILFDSSKNFNIDEFQQRFVIDVFKLDLDLYTLIKLLCGIWDFINDSVFGALVDKTVTRFGKFRPYLVSYALPGAIIGCLFWISPVFFDANPYSFSKFIVWMFILMFKDIVITFRDICETGLLSTMTPNPDDRVRLFSQAEVISSILENIPPFAMGLIIDFVNHNSVGFSMRTAFISAGVFCSIVTGILGIFFAIYARERIQQSQEKHTYRDGIRSIINNPPMLIYLLSDILYVFSYAPMEQNYFIDVLGSASLRNVMQIPGMPLSFMSYAVYPKIRRKYSTKFLWIFGQHLKDFCSLFVFLIGSAGGISNGLYKKPAAMLFVFMGKDILYKSTLAINKVTHKEVLTDALDYGEWKNGFRSEGITLSTNSMLKKIVKNVMDSLTTSMMKRLGYSINAGFGHQTDKTKYSLFFMVSALPFITGTMSMIPKLFYKLTGNLKTQMYTELSEIRKMKREIYTAQADKDDNEKIN